MLAADSQTDTHTHTHREKERVCVCVCVCKGGSRVPARLSSVAFLMETASLLEGTGEGEGNGRLGRMRRPPRSESLGGLREGERSAHTQQGEL